MMGKTHLTLGFFVALLGISVLQPKNPVLFLMIVLISSLLPDIDHPRSTIGKNIKVIGFLFEHRGFFHSIFALTFFSLAIQFMFKNEVYTMGFLIGYLSHLLSDSLTVLGIKIFHPVSDFRIRGLMKTGGPVEYLIFLGLVLLNLWKLFSF